MTATSFTGRGLLLQDSQFGVNTFDGNDVTMEAFSLTNPIMRFCIGVFVAYILIGWALDKYVDRIYREALSLDDVHRFWRMVNRTTWLMIAGKRSWRNFSSSRSSQLIQEISLQLSKGIITQTMTLLTILVTLLFNNMTVVILLLDQDLKLPLASPEFSRVILTTFLAFPPPLYFYIDLSEDFPLYGFLPLILAIVSDADTAVKDQKIIDEYELEKKNNLIKEHEARRRKSQRQHLQQRHRMNGDSETIDYNEDSNNNNLVNNNSHLLDKESSISIQSDDQQRRQGQTMKKEVPLPVISADFFVPVSAQEVMDRNVTGVIGEEAQAAGFLGLRSKYDPRTINSDYTYHDAAAIAGCVVHSMADDDDNDDDEIESDPYPESSVDVQFHAGKMGFDFYQGVDDNYVREFLEEEEEEAADVLRDSQRKIGKRLQLKRVVVVVVVIVVEYAKFHGATYDVEIEEREEEQQEVKNNNDDVERQGGGQKKATESSFNSIDDGVAVSVADGEVVVGRGGGEGGYLSSEIMCKKKSKQDQHQHMYQEKCHHDLEMMRIYNFYDDEEEKEEEEEEEGGRADITDKELTGGGGWRSGQSAGNDNDQKKGNADERRGSIMSLRLMHIKRRVSSPPLPKTTTTFLAAGKFPRTQQRTTRTRIDHNFDNKDIRNSPPPPPSSLKSPGSAALEVMTSIKTRHSLDMARLQREKTAMMMVMNEPSDRGWPVPAVSSHHAMRINPLRKSKVLTKQIEEPGLIALISDESSKGEFERMRWM
eukprot:jgi/Bigna1/140212/aug1.54_g14920